MIERIEQFISATTLFIGGVVLCIMAIEITADVFLRGVVGRGLPATSEVVSRYWMVIVSFLPIAFTEVHRRHIEASVFLDRAPRSMQKWSVYCGYVLSLFIYVLLAHQTAIEALNRFERGAYAEVGLYKFAIWPSYWILPISFSLMVVLLVLRLLQGPGQIFETNEAPEVQDV